MRVLERERIPEGEAGMATREMRGGEGFKREKEKIVGKFDCGVVDWRKGREEY